jgi:hypothetical protein
MGVWVYDVKINETHKIQMSGPGKLFQVSVIDKNPVNCWV